MKRILTLLAGIVSILGLASCGDNSKPNEIVIPVMPIEFAAQGGIERIEVESHGTGLSLTVSDASWLALASDLSSEFKESLYLSEGVHEVYINTTPCEMVEGRSGSVLLCPDGDESKTMTIPVHQAGGYAPEKPDEPETPERPEDPEELPVFWDNSVAHIMGYRGAVKTVERHIDFLNNDGEAELYNLSFDAHGNLLSFEFDDYDVINYVTVEYDGENRITVITNKSQDCDFSFRFTYNDSEKYVPIFEIFEYDLDEMFPVNFRSWMPFLIKGLESISVDDRLEPENNVVNKFESPEGEEQAALGDLIVNSYFDGELFYPEYMCIKYDGNYPQLITSEGEEYASYEIEKEHGKIVKQTMASYYDILFERDTDVFNSISRVVYGGVEFQAEYDEYHHIVKRTVLPTGEYEDIVCTYMVDAVGNWNRIYLSFGGESLAIMRDVTYWN